MTQARRSELRAAALVALATLGVFLLAPPARFLRWDDAANLLDQSAWRGLSWTSLKWMWTTRWYGPWQPLSWLSWALDDAVWGLDPAAFRRTNVVMHALTSGLVVLATRRALPKSGTLAAAAAGLLFGLHPLRVESVVWITERRDCLSGFFAVLSVLLWLDGARLRSLASFFLACLAKGTAVAVVPFLLALDPDAWRDLLPHAGVALFAAAMNLKGFATGDLRVPEVAWSGRLATAASGLWFYALKTVLPWGLSPYYPLPASARELLPGAAAAAGVTALCFHRRVRAWAAPAWLAYAAALAPVSGLLQNGRQVAADRYSYLACLPFALLGGAAVGRLSPRTGRVVVAAAALALSALTVRQAGFWRDDASLWTRAVALAPDAYLPLSNLAQALLSAGDPAARRAFEEVLRVEPRDAEALVNLGTLVEAENPARAEALYREALALRPGSAQAAVDLAGLRARAGGEKEARSLLEGVVARDPGFAAARFNLGMLLLRAGKKEDGLAQLREAVRLEPSLAERLKKR